MSSKLFAFNVSKKVELNDAQWKGDMNALATLKGYCSGGQNYGQGGCRVDGLGACQSYGGPGYYICDNSGAD